MSTNSRQGQQGQQDSQSSHDGSANSGTSYEDRLEELNKLCRKQQLEIAQLQQRLLECQQSLGNVNSVIMRIDDKGKIRFFNEFARQYFGYSSEEIIGQNMVGTIVPETETTGRDLRKMVADIGCHPARYVNNINQNIDREGNIHWVSWTNKAVYDDEGHVQEIICIGNDITELKEAEERVTYLAFHDQLTGLFNRKAFLERGRESLMQARRYGNARALLFLDLDNFKEVNDHYGHNYGDALLVIVGERLRDTVRQTDFLCRYGGDEFLVLLNNPDSLHAESVAARIVAALEAPYDIEGNIIDLVSTSVGISLFPEEASDIEKMIQIADNAMYRAKESGKNRYCCRNECRDSRGNF